MKKRGPSDGTEIILLSSPQSYEIEPHNNVNRVYSGRDEMGVKYA